MSSCWTSETLRSPLAYVRLSPLYLANFIPGHGLHQRCFSGRVYSDTRYLPSCASLPRPLQHSVETHARLCYALPWGSYSAEAPVLSARLVFPDGTTVPLVRTRSTVASGREHMTLEGDDGQHSERTRHPRGRTGHGTRSLRCLGAHQSRIGRGPGAAEA